MQWYPINRDTCMHWTVLQLSSWKTMYNMFIMSIMIFIVSDTLFFFSDLNCLWVTPLLSLVILFLLSWTNSIITNMNWQIIFIIEGLQHHYLVWFLSFFMFLLEAGQAMWGFWAYKRILILAPEAACPRGALCGVHEQWGVCLWRWGRSHHWWSNTETKGLFNQEALLGENSPDKLKKQAWQSPL